MGIVPYICIGSLVSLLGLAGLYRAEDQRGERIVLARTRTFFDVAYANLLRRVAVLWQRISHGALLHSAHFLLQRLLRFARALAHLAERGVRKVQHKRRSISAAEQEQHVDEHMRAVRTHADSIKLSPEERREKRRELLK